VARRVRDLENLVNGEAIARVGLQRHMKKCLLVHKVTTGYLRSNHCRQLADHIPEVVSGTGEGHTVSVFRETK
jgi:hypothetical protein